METPPLRDQAEQILEESFRRSGLGLLGVARAEACPPVGARYDAWIQNGSHGEMVYLERHSASKADPVRLLPGCRSIVVAGINYFQPSAGVPAGHGRIARYAWGRDYHKVLKSKLKSIVGDLRSRLPEARFTFSTDATPLLETHFAQTAGLGFIGKNTLVINDELGSWILIGEILTTLHLAPSEPRVRKRCGIGCTLCIDVCPTRALTSAYAIDATRCISYLTIEHKGSIPVDLRPLIGDWIFGCDLCQEVCPWNARAAITTERDFLQARSGASRELAEILTIDCDEGFRAAFAGSPLMRAGRAGLVRNACVVAANVGAVHLLPRLRTLACDENPIIAEHASWAVARLEGRASQQRSS